MDMKHVEKEIGNRRLLTLAKRLDGMRQSELFNMSDFNYCACGVASQIRSFQREMKREGIKQPIDDFVKAAKFFRISRTTSFRLFGGDYVGIPWYLVRPADCAREIKATVRRRSALAKLPKEFADAA